MYKTPSLIPQTAVVSVLIILLLGFSTATAPVDQQAKYLSAFLHVRDSIGFESYSGVLRGAAGVTRHRAGNSADRALYLAQLLRENGYTIKIAYGRLRGQALSKVVERAIGWTTDPGEGSAGGDSVYDEEIRQELRDHYWVQLGTGRDSWLDLDPTLPTAKPGQTLASLRKSYETLPSFAYQRVEFSIFSEFSIGKQRGQIRLLRFGDTTAGLGHKPLTLLFIYQDGVGRFRYSTGNRFTPVLFVGERIQPALNLQAEAARTAIRNNVSVPPVTVHRLWLEISLLAPGKPAVKKQRLLFSEVAPEMSRLDEVICFTLSTGAANSLALSTRVEQLSLALQSLGGITEPSLPQVLSEKEKRAAFSILNFNRTLGQTLSINFLSGILRAADRLDGGFFADTKYPGPTLVALSLNPVDASMRTDIILFNPRPMPFSASDRLGVAAARFAQGVAASAQEADFIESIFGETTGSAPARDSVSATRRAEADGYRWIALSEDTMSALDSIRLPGEIRRLLEVAAGAGKILILPTRGGSVPRHEELVWWELDGETGAVAGMISPGIGGAEQEGISNLEDWSNIAAAYSPGFTKGWANRLRGLGQSALQALRPPGGVQPAGNPRHTADDILFVYSVIARSLSGNPGVNLSQDIRKLFEPEGLARLRSALSLIGS